MKKKILITGFEPFGLDLQNPSGNWVSWMLEAPADPSYILEGLVLPVLFEKAFLIFKNKYDDFLPDIVILTGWAKNRANLTVERIGINWVDARMPDNNGVLLKNKKIKECGEDGLFTTLDLERLIFLGNSSGVEIGVSTSAGEYVCNELLYRVLSYTKDKNTSVTFFHLPGANDYKQIFQVLSSIVKNI